MKRVFVDTNVIIDIIEERAGMSDALHLLQLGEEGKAELVVSILTMANVAYIARKKYDVYG